MKTKDIIYLLLAVLVLAVAGYLLFTVLLPSNKNTSTANPQNKVEVVGAIGANLDYSIIDKLLDKTKNVDYTVNLDLNTNLGNPSVFGQ